MQALFVEKAVGVDFEFLFDLAQVLKLRMDVQALPVQKHFWLFSLLLRFGAGGKGQLHLVEGEVIILHRPETAFFVS